MRFKATFKTTDQSFAAGFGAVQTASDGGYEKGYENGYDKGHTDGYDKGHTEGHDAGYSEGYEDGYEEGHGAVPSNAKFQVVAYNADGHPLEVSVCSEGDTETPSMGFTQNVNYLSSFWSKIEKVNLPSTVTAIGKQGFQGLTQLREVTNWDNLETISNEAFSNCKLSKHDHLPPKLTGIGHTAFLKCAMPLTELPNGLVSIGSNAFQYCGSPMNIVKLPPNLVNISSYAFYNNGFACVSFSEVPASVQTIGTQAFRGACLGIVGSLTFKGTPTSIAANAFEMGTNVTDVYVPWAEGAVAGAPWGMTKATIHYESEV